MMAELIACLVAVACPLVLQTAAQVATATVQDT
jgi:hypothetical protein